jgi:iron complex outermembrane recepter protein
MTVMKGLVALASVLALLTPSISGPPLAAQQAAPTGTITGRVVDEDGNGVGGAQIYIDRPALGTQTRNDGQYTLGRVPPGSYVLHARLLGYRPEAANVTVSANARVTQSFTLRRDPLELQTMVVTGTQSPRMNLDASVAVTTLTATEIQASAPRSTTEMLRYVPGFTRVESSGGEVNQNISIRGILGVEYVAFLEDGLPVFPTMHTFFMNADNLFRFDTNIDRMEVVRGGSSPLFGSNTPGAIVNFINKTGGDLFGGTMRASAATEGLARYDLNMNGPFGDDWRFSVGGFYRYDHGVRDPGFPGIRGGQLKANITRLLDNGYLRFSAKYLDDRNQFILPLPFTNPEDPEYVEGFSDYGAMSTNEGLDIGVPLPTGDRLTLPLDNGLRTKGTWFTADASFDLSEEWHLQNTAQVMNNDQEWNAILPFDVKPAAEYVSSLGFPAGTTGQFFFTNHKDPLGNPLPFDTQNGLVSPGGEWHVEKPLTAVQDQLSLRRTFGRHALNIGGYFANYTQENRWFFTDILMDVRDNPRFLDLRLTGAPVTNFTKDGFRNYLSNYANGTGSTTILSGVIGAEVQLTDRLRADLGARVEYNDFVQNSENTAKVDLDGDTISTRYDFMLYGTNTFRHFTKGLTDWSASVGLNYRLNDRFSIYASGARAYKMPALDEFLNASTQAQVDIFESRELAAAEAGVKFDAGQVGFTVNAFYNLLMNITGQGAEVCPGGGTCWVIRASPDNRSYGTEIEAVASPIDGMQIMGSATFLEAELGGGVDSLAHLEGEPLGAPRALGNLALFYSPRRVTGLQFKADWHFVGSRFVESPLTRVADTKLPEYNYFNFGVGLAMPNSGVRLNVDLLNAFQSKGLEEGNPRLVSQGGTPIFLARPLLPRRLQASIEYDFGGGAPLDR